MTRFPCEKSVKRPRPSEGPRSFMAPDLATGDALPDGATPVAPGETRRESCIPVPEGHRPFRCSPQPLMALGAHPRATPPFEEVSRLPYSGDLRSLFWLVPRHG